MKITFLGQAGLFIETKHGSILCDPWFNTAYFASWFPFPSNEFVDIKKISNPTYLYISHLHHDHFDPKFLRDHVSKNAIVLLPDFPLNHLEQELRAIGFEHFVHTKNCTPVEMDGLRFMIYALTAPTDGPIGDSGLMVDDGETRIFNQNDSRPVDMDLLNSFGPFDALFLQFSGAIWYPMVYKFPKQALDALSRKKRENELARALRYINEIDAKYVVPSAGPPCFLDDDLYYLNDLNRDETNIFPDQTVFLEYMEERGVHSGRLMIPDSVMTLEHGQCHVEHPLPDDEVAAIFKEKDAYLKAYQARQRATIEAARASWPRGQVNVLESLKSWFEPLMQQADLTAAGINGNIILDLDDEKICLDFQRRKVEAWDGKEWDYIFEIDRALVEKCVVEHYEDWVNELFLSCRFRAERKGGFNEHVYNFFKCLSQERLQYLEGYLAEKAPVKDLFECEGYLVQRRCPHLKADLARFGHVEDGILTCRMHGWQFDLETGRCLTSDDRQLYTKKLDAGKEVPAARR
ncbi:Rieske 2Fe-2S domain-containing protein [Alicyclobacillus cycloheptanicus]|uniref:UDP-MurNAc hydroxylase n=1 Tax=Alicyclobacillus cycloheptanicus TaxID=1457 RepID=A0ABT9XLX1_9BACL|nr:Rieske 2Fe-2S domain-containing protein [Alicyclobacillus cycloheptanicus]MDQ0191120.1 UDP-MurNAc hydroxylase [Alicyclobacillus cycloheptanicus]WDM02743.1 Rieske 2Fe-2S domain-containing protein [Alicyclobacillus cycloheptanicus]